MGVDDLRCPVPDPPVSQQDDVRSPMPYPPVSQQDKDDDGSSVADMPVSQQDVDDDVRSPVPNMPVSRQALHHGRQLFATPVKTRSYKSYVFSPRTTRSNHGCIQATTPFSSPNTRMMSSSRRLGATHTNTIGNCGKRRKAAEEKVDKQRIDLNKPSGALKKAKTKRGMANEAVGKTADMLTNQHLIGEPSTSKDTSESRLRNVPRYRVLKYLQKLRTPQASDAVQNLCVRSVPAETQNCPTAVSSKAENCRERKSGKGSATFSDANKRKRTSEDVDDDVEGDDLDSQRYRPGQQKCPVGPSTKRTNRVKGPPAKGLLIQREMNKRRRTTLDSGDDGSDNDSDYHPSSDDLDESDTEADSNAEFVEDNLVESEVSVNSEAVWSSSTGPGNTFECNTMQAIIADFVPTSNYTAVDFFQLFLTDEILKCMVDETNRNAQQNLHASPASPASRILQWKDTDVDEIRRFIGIVLWMGLVNMPSIAHYWSRDCLYRNGIANTTMTRNRFQLLLRMWHFADNSEMDQVSQDQLHKIRYVMDLLVKNFAAARQPGENLVIDESMVPFRGRLKFRQYLPGKSHKYGVKLFKVCDPSAYTYNVKVYAGKEERCYSDLATSVVMQLMDPYLDAGRTLSTDNFYTSIPLARELLKRKTHLVGTLRKNRKMLPTDVTGARLNVGETVARQSSDGIVVQKWRDRRDVLMLSTKHDDSMETVPRRRSTVSKPVMVAYYNKNKQGIDVSDQLASYHNCLRKTIRWYHKVIIELLLGTSVVNAMILFNEQQLAAGLPAASVTQFRESLCKAMLQTGVNDEDKAIHYLRETAQKEGGKRADRRVRRYCIGCYDQMVKAQDDRWQNSKPNASQRSVGDVQTTQDFALTVSQSFIHVTCGRFLFD